MVIALTSKWGLRGLKLLCMSLVLPAEARGNRSRSGDNRIHRVLALRQYGTASDDLTNVPPRRDLVPVGA